MAFITDLPKSSIFSGIAHFFEGLSQSIDLAASSKARVAQMERLNSKTDAELDALGLRREDIARYVFRDILYI